jgi:SAM-dependent methyltransferase
LIVEGTAVGLIGGHLGYLLLRLISSDGETGYCDGSVYRGKSKLEVLFGKNVWEEFKGKTVLDFGCGTGEQSIEIAQHGAERVIGLDIRESVLTEARRAASEAGVDEICEFTTTATEKADIVLSMDAFEHFDDPDGVLRAIRNLLKDDGFLMLEFGATWYHPLGGHLFSVFPWAHLIFTEKALIRWRSDFKTDGATRFSEVEGGLNQMTIGRFEQIVRRSLFDFVSFEAVPIRRLAAFSTRWTREFTTAIVRARLKPHQLAPLD